MKAISENKTDFFDSAKFNEERSLNLAESLNKRWQELCERFLPISSNETIWRYSRLGESGDPEQGWKIHISATILNAVSVLESVAPFLTSQRALFKAPVSLGELKKINSGIYYNYSQIGKFITVYPQSNEQAVYFAKRLHQLTKNFSAPAIPFDFRFKPQSCVYYRYGAFVTFELKNPDGFRIFAMRDQNGKLIPDLRATEEPQPDWITNPFPVSPPEKADAQLPENYKIFRALSQRGKGGVYQAVDFCAANPRFCLIKEGRKNGEVEWDGRDGFWSVRREKKVLETMRRARVRVPEVYSSFETENNFYLVTEFIEGETLHRFLQNRKRRLNVVQAIKYGIQLASLLSRIHSAGWLWGDCKPDNLIVAENGELRPIDFEGACRITESDYAWCGTLTAELLEDGENVWRRRRINHDLFALGAIIYLLFEGELPKVKIAEPAPPILRGKVPREIRNLVSLLLDPEPTKYPTAETVEKSLSAALKFAKTSPALNL